MAASTGHGVVPQIMVDHAVATSHRRLVRDAAKRTGPMLFVIRIHFSGPLSACNRRAASSMEMRLTDPLFLVVFGTLGTVWVAGFRMLGNWRCSSSKFTCKYDT